MCFARMFIPWREQLSMLTGSQKFLMYAFIYEREVMREGILDL
ncbi:hypothetical protein [uncultured Clostridium sp.]|nr:hypothetical protein [uncultured Clostridium sp.]